MDLHKIFFYLITYYSFIPKIYILSLQAYERRFPTCPQIPVFVGCDITLDEESEDGAIRTTERRCKLNVEAPYILKKVNIWLIYFQKKIV